MPDMNGLEMLRRVRREYPKVRVIMFSTLTERGAAITLEALTLGADEYVAKVANEGSLDRSLARLREDTDPEDQAVLSLPRKCVRSQAGHCSPRPRPGRPRQPGKV